jgi:hypothetical protein
MTTVEIRKFDGTTEEQEFAVLCAKCLQDIVNTDRFINGVKNANYSYRRLWDDVGNYIDVDNEKIIEIIQSGKERKSQPDNTISLEIAIRKMRRGTVGSVNPPKSLITTNSRYFSEWLENKDIVSGAAHWLHEWLHVAGFLHNDGGIDSDDVNYTVGKLAVDVGRSLQNFAMTAERSVPILGEGYLNAIETAIQFNAQTFVRTLDLNAAPQKSLQLGFVDLGSDSRPIANKTYPIISAGNAQLEVLPVPSTVLKTLKLDILGFYNDHMPDFLGGGKEGLFKISINTRNPQLPASGENDVTIAVDFKVKDGQYAPSFLYKGVFRNVLFSDWINLKFDLFELDTDAEVYYNKVKGVIDTVPELRNLDILNGIPYLNLASKLFEGIIKTFGKNADDHMWQEMPILEIVPSIGGAFLRSGIYVIFQRTNSKDEDVTFENIIYKDNRLEIKDSTLRRLSNHMLLSIALSNTSGT